MWWQPRIPALAQAALPLVLLCAACSPTRLVPQDIPVALTELPPRPLPPADPTDRDVALLIVGQDEVIQACYSQMARIRTLLAP